MKIAEYIDKNVSGLPSELADIYCKVKVPGQMMLAMATALLL